MSVEIRIYHNQLSLDEFEPQSFEAGKTLNDYLCARVPTYHERPVPLFSATINGELLAYEDWGNTRFSEGDLVECFVEPKDPVTVTIAVIAVASAAYAIHVANQPLPDTYNSTTPKGSPIYEVNAQGNRPRLMGTVPVLLGRHKVFPDYLNPPRTEYINNEQYFYAMMSVALGSVAINLDDVWIGDTRASQLGDDVDFAVFNPGESVIGHPANLNTYTSSEVDGLVIHGSMDEAVGPPSVSWKSNGQFVTDSGYPHLRKYLWRFWPGDYDTPDRNTDWTNWYYREHSESILGKILELFDSTANDGYYLIESTHISDYASALVKLNDDLTVDSSWIGFNGDLTKNPFWFSADYRVIDVDQRFGWWLGPFTATPDGGVTDAVTLDFRFDQGLCILNSSGQPTSRSVEIEIEWRANGGSWNTINKTFSGSTVDQIAFTVDINVSNSSNVDVRVRRLTSEISDITYKDKLTWAALRCALASKASYPEFTTIAMRIKGSNTIAGSSNNKISCIATGINRDMGAGDSITAPQQTRSISSAIMRIADDIGYQIDIDELRRLHQVWESRGDEFNAVFDNATTAWKAMQQVLAVGFSEPTLDFGKIIPVRDEARTLLNYQYQADNILPNSWKMEGAFVDTSEKDGVEVEYFSSETWKPETILCLLPGDAGDNPEKVRAFGITDKTAAYRFGMRKRATQVHRRIRHHFSTEMDALNSRYMSYDALGIDMPGYSQTGRVESVGGQTLYLNQDLQWGSGTHYIGVRRPDGTLSGPYRCTPGATSDSVVIASSLDFSPVFNGVHEPPYFMFGVADEWCVPVLVTDIKPSGTDSVKVTAFEYSDDVYLYDDAVPL